jgi:hypothetical protein
LPPLSKLAAHWLTVICKIACPHELFRPASNQQITIR